MAIIDPEVLAWLENSGPLPAPPPGTGGMKDWGSALTQYNKAGNLNTDLDWLISQGLLSPEAFGPITTQAPAEAPGYLEVQQWAGSSDPFQRFVADAIMKGQGPFQIQSVLQQMAADPKDETELAIINTIPRGYIQDPASGEYTQTEQPDLRSAFDEVSRLASAYTQDPAYQIGPDGMPMTSTQETSPAQQALLEAGYTTTPGQPYDPYSLAPQGTLERDARLTEAEQRAMAEYQLAQQGYDSAAGQYRALSEQYQPDGLGSAIQDRIAAGTAGGPMSRPELDQSTAGKVLGGVGDVVGGVLGFNAGAAKTAFNAPLEIGSAITNAFRGPDDQRDAPRADFGWLSDALHSRTINAEGLRPQNAPTRRQPDRSRIDATKANKYEEARKAMMEKKRTGKSRIESSNAAFAARKQNEMREAYARALLAQGRSPFDDERNRRNMSAMGF